MKTKHTFAFTFILGLVWTGWLFGYATGNGPDPGYSGVFNGVNCTACHSQFAPNTGTGSVSIGGLPTSYNPGQTYSLTVTVNRPNQNPVKYGFQLSAVKAGTTTQAGSFSAASPSDFRVFISTGTIQYVQHNQFASNNGTYSFRWTAPSSASFGSVQFDVSGNGSNSDTTSSGDIIYTNRVTIPEAVADTTPPVISAVTSSSVTTSGATINWTTDEASDTQVDYGTTTSYGSLVSSGTLATSHSISITGLSPFTTYHYRVKSKDASNNQATGADNTFVTGFSISNQSGVSRITDGTASSTTTGYARIQSTSGTTPSGVAIFGLRQAGTLVTEAGVPDSPLITAGRFYAEVSGSTVDTGLAIANPNSSPALISFIIRDSTGATVVNNSTTIDPNKQLVAFIDQAPFSSGQLASGTFSFTSSQPVSVIALRSLVNERTPNGDFLITTLPVVDLSASTTTTTQVIPDFAAGGGWTTRIILLDPRSSPSGNLTGSIQFLDRSGAAQSVSIDGTSGTSANYTVNGNSSKKFVITGLTSDTSAGTVRVVPSGGTVAPVPLVVFSYKPSTITVSEAGVPVVMGTTFRLFAQLSATPNIASGVAVANATAVAGTVTFTLFALDGTTQLGQSSPQTLPASGQVVGFLDQLIPSLAGQTVQGILRVTTTASSISVVGLRTRINERSDFMITTTPATLEDGTPGTAERLFPQLADGGGYTTQFVLFSGTSGQTSGGTLNFVKPDGTTLSLNIN